MSARALVLGLHAPWIGSVAIMFVTMVVYFSINPFPAAFTETVLGIIITGTAVAGGSTTFNLMYKTRKPGGVWHDDFD